MANKVILNEKSYHKSGAINFLPEEILSRKLKKALVCTDKALSENGIISPVLKLLDNSHIPYCIFSDIKPNPTVKNIQDGVDAYNSCKADCVVAIGGGSVIDTSKGISIIISNPEFGDVLSLEGLSETTNKCAPLFAVPTTAGTAAEVTINYVVTDEKKKRKFVCTDPRCVPYASFVDPDLMVSMPKELAACTGMDALTHAVEGYITKGAWEFTDMLHLKAIELISHSLPSSVNGNKEAIDNMALGQYIAGMGFSNAGLGIVHSMAHALGAIYDMPHGLANAVLLPLVMEYNAECTGEKYRAIACAMGVKNTDIMNEAQYRQAAVDAVKQLSKTIGIPKNLSDIVNKEDINLLSEMAYNDVCRPGNPREATIEDIKEIYLKIF